MAICQYHNIRFWSYLFGLGTKPFREKKYCYSINLIYTIAHCSMLFPTVSRPITSALAANFAYLYILPLCTFFSSLYHNVVIQSTSLQHCDIQAYILTSLVRFLLVSQGDITQLRFVDSMMLIIVINTKKGVRNLRFLTT